MTKIPTMSLPGDTVFLTNTDQYVRTSTCMVNFLKQIDYVDCFRTIKCTGQKEPTFIVVDLKQTSCVGRFRSTKRQAQKNSSIVENFFLGLSALW